MPLIFLFFVFFLFSFPSLHTFSAVFWLGASIRDRVKKSRKPFFFFRSTALVDEKLETQNCGQRTTRVFDDSLVWCWWMDWLDSGLCRKSFVSWFVNLSSVSKVLGSGSWTLHFVYHPLKYWSLTWPPVRATSKQRSTDLHRSVQTKTIKKKMDSL